MHSELVGQEYMLGVLGSDQSREHAVSFLSDVKFIDGPELLLVTDENDLCRIHEGEEGLHLLRLRSLIDYNPREPERGNLFHVARHARRDDDRCVFEYFVLELSFQLKEPFVFLAPKNRIVHALKVLFQTHQDSGRSPSDQQALVCYLEPGREGPASRSELFKRYLCLQVSSIQDFLIRKGF